MFKKVFLILVILLGFAAVYFYNQPEPRYMFEVKLKTFKLESSIKALGAKRTCSDEATKKDCFLHFFRANGSVQFSTDLGLFMVSIFNICNNKRPCVLDLSDQLIQSLDFNNFWIQKSKHARSKFGVEIMKVEAKYIDNVLRNFRKKLMTDYVIEQEPARKKLIVEYVKNLDAKLIELGLAN